ncbi:MAG: UDP-glucose 4-epimerase [Flaviaesturariibacter sp.]|nr:UDP-glucose 4-epimerase [Flaviaesturariibacter sp.]
MAITGTPSPHQSRGIALTGSRGFIGKALAARLATAGAPCIAFPGNLLSTADLESFFEQHPVDQVVHLVGGFEGDFDRLLETNVRPTQHLLEVGRRYGLRKVIYASTGAVYGEPLGDTSKETDPLLPNTLYGLAKKLTEETLHFYTRQYGIDAVILRFPNVYGEGNAKGVLYHFLQAIRRDGALTIAGDGSQSRNFLHVTDACIAIEKALAFEGSGIFNISNPVKVSIRDLVDQLACHYSFGVNYREQDNFLKDLLLDTTKAEQVLGFRAVHSDTARFFEGSVATGSE